MTQTSLKDAIDGVRAVVFTDDESHHAFTPTFVAWHGGTYFNVYHTHNGNIHESEGFSVSDDDGEPLDRDAAVGRMQDWLDEQYS